MQSQYPPEVARKALDVADGVTLPTGHQKSPNVVEIRTWMISYVSELLEVDPSEIDIGDTLASYGIDSSGAVGMIGDLGSWLGRTLDPALLYSYPTIKSLTDHLLDGGGR